MKLDGLSHPKTKELAYTLEVPLPHAVGLLELLFAFVGQQTPQGNVGKWSNAVIAGEAGWHLDADHFVESLVAVGFLDQDDVHGLLVHDWADHCPNWVHAKLKKAGKQIIRADLSTDLRGRYKPSEAKASQDKSKSTDVEPDDSPPSNGEVAVIDPVVIGLPTNKHSTKGEEYCVLETHVAEFRALYPAVDVDQNLRNMRGWLVNNPTKRKTLKGMSTFVNSWLAREQDKARGSPNKSVSTRSKTLEEDLTDTSWAH
ncbi:MAG: hypothetical protein AAGB19_13070 [Cyanobacteria bacterium P01_F01_bin.3]